MEACGQSCPLQIFRAEKIYDIMIHGTTASIYGVEVGPYLSKVKAFKE